ncbi:short chain dehydrogenase reductase [Xylariales sp. PMI_506]|nr:short chain dehydrogenase reductase [Xylariales sp. PMI_506]
MASIANATIALISGANQGLGRSVATRLAKEHGYHVIIGSRDLSAGEAVAAELRADGHAATAVQLDLTSDASIDAAVSDISEKFGRLDVLVNNAGILLDSGSVFVKKSAVPTRELFERTFQVNVFGTACLTEAVLPLLRAMKEPAKPPRVVFVSTIMGSLGIATNPETPFYKVDYKSYDASKAAVNMLAINYARILGDVSGRVNAVCPGLVRTSLIGNSPMGDPPELGAQRVVELATLGPDGPTCTFSNRDGPLSW